MKKLIIFAITLCSLIACNKKDEVDNMQSAKSGAFEIQYTGSSNKISNTLDQIDFDLGDLKASKEFYFTLSNVGETPITDIEITSNREDFKCFPQSIPQLNSLTVGSVMEIGLIHGRQLNGTGEAEVMPMAENTGIINISGKTTDSDGKEIITAVDIHLETFVKLADIKLMNNDIDIDLFEDGIYYSQESEGQGNHYQGVPLDNPLFINTGNVDLSLEIEFYAPNDLQTYDIKSGDTISFLLPSPTYENPIDIRINSDGTIAAGDKFYIANNGEIRMRFNL